MRRHSLGTLNVVPSLQRTPNKDSFCEKLHLLDYPLGVPIHLYHNILQPGEMIIKAFILEGVQMVGEVCWRRASGGILLGL